MGQKGDSMCLTETQPTQFHELCLLSPSVGNPKLLEVRQREKAQALLLVLQFCKQAASLRPELQDQVLQTAGAGPRGSVKTLGFGDI